MILFKDKIPLRENLIVCDEFSDVLTRLRLSQVYHLKKAICSF